MNVSISVACQYLSNRLAENNKNHSNPSFPLKGSIGNSTSRVIANLAFISYMKDLSLATIGFYCFFR